jgi:hypothetical protein
MSPLQSPGKCPRLGIVLILTHVYNSMHQYKEKKHDHYVCCHRTTPFHFLIALPKNMNTHTINTTIRILAKNGLSHNEANSTAPKNPSIKPPFVRVNDKDSGVRSQKVLLQTPNS